MKCENSGGDFVPPGDHQKKKKKKKKKFISSRINCTNGFKASNVSTGISNEIQVKIREVKENDLWIIDANQILSFCINKVFDNG
jgi:hypothetical protein